MTESGALKRYSIGAATGVVVVSLMIGSAGPALARPAFPDTTDDDFQSECLAKHNQLRERHGVPAMTISPKLVAHAKKRVQELSMEEGLTAGYQGNQDSGFGENISWKATNTPGYNYACGDAVQAWYSEVDNYRFGEEGHQRRTEEFTQVVWKSSTELGCARASGKGTNWAGESYVLCSYSPSGNYGGKYKDNVPAQQ
ncbi:CAP family protein [Nocardia sp. NPDC060256]|uniref:CAP family protein n=1 Tax=unclassified Nocardia TaxID=2637762 RepID=UPI00364F0C30